MSKAYASNLTSDQWELLEPLIPAANRAVGLAKSKFGTSSTPYFTFYPKAAVGVLWVISQHGKQSTPTFATGASTGHG